MPEALTRRTLLGAAGVLAAVAASEVLIARPARAASASLLNIVAHPDDDLFFMNPDVLTVVTAGGSVCTVYTTAGDAGQPASYWQSREQGVQAAYAQMAGATNSWTSQSLKVGGVTVLQRTLTGHSQIRLVFLRLPDGDTDAKGYSSTGFVSVPQLQQGQISSISAIDGSATYSLSTLQATYLALMTSVAPTTVNTLNFVGAYGDGDHPDHHAVAYIAKAASQQYATSHTQSGYEGYTITSKAANLTTAQVAAKSNAYYAYAPYDAYECTTPAACSSRPEAGWLQRMYVVSTGSVGGTSTTPGGSNIAASAAVTASSENASSGQTAVKVIDGVASGYPASATNEWATVGGGVGSWVQLTWSSAVSLDGVVLFDRPNTDDQITGGHLLFSDGSTVTIGSLPNDGSASTTTFTARTVTSVRLVVDAVSSTTVNVGLAEFQAWGTAGATTPPPSSGTDLALAATATASSENASTGQTAAKAIDGKTTGYPTDATTEWATQGGGVGSTLTLTWTTAQTVSSVVLYDRPNTDDQVTAATLTFSDGSVVQVPTLNNDGSATTVTFTSRTTTSLKFTVTGVSSTTRNVGLAEIVVLGS